MKRNKLLGFKKVIIKFHFSLYHSLAVHLIPMKLHWASAQVTIPQAYSSLEWSSIIFSLNEASFWLELIPYLAIKYRIPCVLLCFYSPRTIQVGHLKNVSCNWQFFRLPEKTHRALHYLFPVNFIRKQSWTELR